MPLRSTLPLTLALALAMSACSSRPDPASLALGATAAPASDLSALAGQVGQATPRGQAMLQASAASTAGAPEIVVHKGATCGCCEAWIEHLKASGFKARSVDEANLAAVKADLGVPQPLASCHTATVGGYVIEGHVPAEDIRRLLATRPNARGLAVPGMPLGSPGMDAPEAQRQHYQVQLIENDGTTRVFAQH